MNSSTYGEKIKYIFVESASLDPYFNLGLEKYLFDSLHDGELIFFLWQNEKTIVCGRNQNVYKECSVANLKRNGGRIARRLSGGGAVFHDKGNLNFTFIAGDGDYNADRQLDVIVKACERFKLSAERTGRNDIAIDGRKFSGNAFYSANGAKMHHGTIMIDVNETMLETSLSVSPEKLAFKGVDSVRSRVVNLSQLCPEITVESMKTELKAAFLQVYQAKEFSETLYIGEKTVLGGSADGNAVSFGSALSILKGVLENRSLFESDEWIYGTKFEFTNVISKRFTWGLAELCLYVKGETVTAAKIYSDALAQDYILELERRITGVRYNYNALASAAREASKCCGSDTETMSEDIKKLLHDSM